jgi:hypothetical protein
MVAVVATLVGVAVRVASSAGAVVAWGFLRRRDIFNEGTLAGQLWSVRVAAAVQ